MPWEQLLTGKDLRLEVVAWDGRKMRERATTQKGRNKKNWDGFNNKCS